MASMSTAAATLAAVPAGSRIGGMESSVRSCPAPSTFLMGQNKATVPLRRSSLVARASASGSASEQNSQVWNVAKNAAAAAAISLVLSASASVQAKEPNAFPKFPNNAAGESAKEILQRAKKEGDDSFAEAQRTGQETTGQAASAKFAAPAISQVDPDEDGSPDLIGDTIASKADEAAEKAPGTDQQKGKGFVNPIEKALSTPQRGLGEGGLPKNGLL